MGESGFDFVEFFKVPAKNSSEILLPGLESINHISDLSIDSDYEGVRCGGGFSFEHNLSFWR